MKILFVTTYPLEYSTSANVRNMGLIQGLRDNGYDISTFSCYPNDPHLYSGDMLDFPFYKRYWIGPKTMIAIDHTKKSFAGRLKRIASKIVSNMSVYDGRAFLSRQIKSNMIEEDYEYIISSSDPKSAHLFAEKLISSHSSKLKKWIQYWGDPFTNDISVDHRFSNRRIQKEEERLLSLANKAVYVSPFTLNDMQIKYPALKNKLIFQPIPYYKKTTALNVITDKSLIGYLGDYNTKNRNILPLVEAVKKINVNTVIAGTSDLVIPSTEKLKVYGRLHGKDIDELAAKVGIYICVCNLHGTQIPGKVYHYVDSRKPILIILDGDNEDELKDYFDGFNRFYTCKNNSTDISETLQRIIMEYHSFETPPMLNAKVIATKVLE